MIKRIVLALIILITLIIAYNMVMQILEATKSGERLSHAADVVYKLEIKNKELRQKLSQIQSPEFIEGEARNKLGLTKAGETLVIIPQEKIKMVLGVSQSAQIKLPNWLGWLKIFFK